MVEETPPYHSTQEENVEGGLLTVQVPGELLDHYYGPEPPPLYSSSSVSLTLFFTSTPILPSSLPFTPLYIHFLILLLTTPRRPSFPTSFFCFSFPFPPYTVDSSS